MNQEQRIQLVQSQIKGLADSLIKNTHITSNNVKMCIFYLGLNLPYSFITQQLSFSNGYIRKIKSTHLNIVTLLQAETASLYTINGVL